MFDGESFDTRSFSHQSWLIGLPGIGNALGIIIKASRRVLTWRAR